MSGVTRALLLTVSLVLISGCGGERYSLRQFAHRPSFLPQRTATLQQAPAIANEYEPQVDEIPLPPTGASYEEREAPQPTQKPSSSLKPVERPPLLLRPTGWEFRQTSHTTALAPPRAH
ncbi:MAG: hypothetical protein R3C18_18990 [Planctomycetaceae bacterium]